METAAAILVQILFSEKGTNIKNKLNEQAVSPEAAATFLKPYWIEMMKALKRGVQETPAIR